MTSTPGPGASTDDLAQSPTGVALADAAAPDGGVGPSPRSQRAALFDGDEHTRTRALLERRALWIVVNADDARIWPPQRAAVVTRTWCRIRGLLPW